MPFVIQKLLGKEDIRDEVILENSFTEVDKNKFGIKQYQVGITKRYFVLAFHALSTTSSVHGVEYYHEEDMEPPCLMEKMCPIDSIDVTVFSYHYRILQVRLPHKKVIYLELSERQNEKKIWKKWLTWIDAIQKTRKTLHSESEESDYSSDSTMIDILENPFKFPSKEPPVLTIPQEKTDNALVQKSYEPYLAINKHRNRSLGDDKWPHLPPERTRSSVVIHCEDDLEVIPVEISYLLHSKKKSLPHKNRVISWVHLKEKSDRVLNMWLTGVPEPVTPHSKLLNAFAICYSPTLTSFPPTSEICRIQRVRRIQSEPCFLPHHRCSKWLMQRQQLNGVKQKLSHYELNISNVMEIRPSHLNVGYVDDLHFWIRIDNEETVITLPPVFCGYQVFDVNEERRKAQLKPYLKDREDYGSSSISDLFNEHRQDTKEKGQSKQCTWITKFSFLKTLLCTMRKRTLPERTEESNRRRDEPINDEKSPTFSHCKIKPLSKFKSMCCITFARVLTRIEITLFCAITVPEVINMITGRYSLLLHYPVLKIHRLLLFSERLRLLTVTEILKGATCRERASLIVRFVMVATECVIICNFQSAFAILFGLLSAPVLMLGNTWNYVRKKHHARYKDFLKLCQTYRTPDFRRHIMLEALNKKNHVIPYFTDFLHLCKTYRAKVTTVQNKKEECFCKLLKKLLSDCGLKQWVEFGITKGNRGKKEEKSNTQNPQKSRRSKIENKRDIKKESLSLSDPGKISSSSFSLINSTKKKTGHCQWHSAHNSPLSEEARIMLSNEATDLVTNRANLDIEFITRLTEIIRSNALTYDIDKTEEEDIRFFLTNSHYDCEIESYQKAKYLEGLRK